MRKLFIICLLMVTDITTQAQNMSFDETVKYIQDKIKCCSEYKDYTFSATSNGQISIKKSGPDITTFNLFDLKDAAENPWNVFDDKGIMLIAINGNKSYILCFQVSDGKDECAYWFDVQAEGERVYRALLYLRSLCTKEKDPFDN